MVGFLSHPATPRSLTVTTKGSMREMEYPFAWESYSMIRMTAALLILGLEWGRIVAVLVEARL